MQHFTRHQWAKNFKGQLEQSRISCDASAFNNVFALTCLHGGAEVSDLGHMQMSCPSYFQHVLIHLELAAE